MSSSIVSLAGVTWGQLHVTESVSLSYADMSFSLPKFEFFHDMPLHSTSWTSKRSGCGKAQA